MAEGWEAKLKRRETKSWGQEAGRSPLVRAGARWLSFARRLSRARRRAAAADPLAFVESLYGGKFNSVEGGASAPDKVYRTNGGRHFVSETRVSLSLYPRFDVRVVNVAAVVAGSPASGETRTAFGHLLHKPLSERERPRAARQSTPAKDGAPSSKVRTWDVSPLVAGAYVSSFGYVTVRGSRGQGPQGFEPTSPASRFERVASDGGTAGPGVDASRLAVAPSPAGLRLTSVDLQQHFAHAPRQEFVSLLLNTYIPARVVESARTTGVLLSAPQRLAAARGETARRYAQAPSAVVLPWPQTAPWTHAGPGPRHTPDGRVGLSAQTRSTGTSRELSAARDTQAPLLHLPPPASLLTSLSSTARTLLAGEGGGTGLTAYVSGERAPAPSLQLISPRAAHPGAREGTAVVHTTRLVRQSTRHQPAGGRDVLSSRQTFGGRSSSTAAAGTHAAHTTIFARPGFVTVPLRGPEKSAARGLGASSVAAQTLAVTHSLPGRAVEFVRRTSGAELMRAAAINDAGPQAPSGHAPKDVTTRGSAGAATFLFGTGVTRRVASAAAARPEGMALELIRHRREEVLQLPRPGYVFTQPPARTQLEERQAITKATREQIVEVVRKEVRSLAASAPAAATPSRADLAGLADELYSTLARRLLVEKERLGRF